MDSRQILAPIYIRGDSTQTGLVCRPKPDLNVCYLIFRKAGLESISTAEAVRV